MILYATLTQGSLCTGYEDVTKSGGNSWRTELPVCFSPTSVLGTLPREGKSADIPSRGMTASELSKNHLWMSGSDWLCTSQDLPGEEMNNDAEVPEEAIRK